MKKARYQVGMLDFEYTASLHIEHFKLDPEVLSDRLNLSTRRTHQAGAPRLTPTGTPLSGEYKTAFWCADLDPRDGEDIAGFLSRLAEDLNPARELIQQVVEGGGSVECFIGLFAKQLCDQILPSSLLLRLGTLGINSD